MTLKVYVQVLLWLYLGSFIFLCINATNCSCYLFFTSKLRSWDESQKQCSTNRGNLVSIETEGEWKFINGKVQQRNSSDNKWWIGLRNRNGKWEWINGRLLDMSKWHIKVQQPGGDSGCVVMAKDSPPGYQGLFKSIKCDRDKQLICETEINEPMCQNIGKDYIYCTGARGYAASTRYYTGNDSKTSQKQVPSLSLNTTSTAPPQIASTTNSTQSSSSSDKIGILIFIVMFGIILFVFAVCFIYVFCWWVYQPGYQGDVKKTHRRLQEVSPSFSHSSIESSKPENARFYVDLNNDNDAYRTDESWDTSDSEDLHQAKHHTHLTTPKDSSGTGEMSDETVPVLYAQINNPQSGPSSIENQGATEEEVQAAAAPVVYAQVHKSLSSTPLMEEHDLNGQNSFEMKPIDSNSAPDPPKKDDQRPKIPTKPPRGHIVVYANLQDLKHKPSDQPGTDSEDTGRDRSKTTYAKDPVPSQRRKTWSSRSRWYDVDNQKSDEINDVTGTREEPEGSATGVAPSSTVIYAQVDISKKTKNKAQENDK